MANTFRHCALGVLGLSLLVGVNVADGAVQTWYGPAGGPVSGWDNGSDSISWTAMPSLNSPINPALSKKGELDFVGDSSNAGFYTAQNASYLFFRMRVDIGTVTGTTFTGAHLLLIDVIGWNYPVNGQEGKPDFAIAWDSKSNDPVKHGMEMQIPPSNLIQATTWGQVQMDDIDVSSGQKAAPPDINTTGQGYIRTVDGQNTTNFGTTTLIDFAIALSYLNPPEPPLGSNPNLPNILNYNLRFQLGSIDNATDHNVLNADVAGGFALGSTITTSWGAVVVPEPSRLAVVGMGGLFVLWLGRRCRQREGL